VRRFDYPIYLDLRDVPVLVVGAGPVAARKVAGLAAAGARVRVVAPSVSPVLDRALVDEVRERPFEPADLNGVRLVVTATGSRDVDASVAAAATAAGLWVNAADQPDDCSFVLDTLTHAPVALIGHSMGGRVASWIAAHQPDRAWALALLDARLGAVPRERAEKWRGARTGDAPPRHYATRAEALAAFRLTPPEADVAADLRAELAAHAIMQRPDGRWMMAFDRAVLALDGTRVEDLVPVVARVRCPTLILRGRDSTVIGAVQSAALREAAPAAIQETVAGGHHFLLAHPEETAARLAQFLRDLR